MGKPAPKTRIQKSGNGHTYYLDGEWCPGVTTVLSNGIPKNGLIGWAGGTVADFVVNRLQVTRNPEGKARIVADDLVRDALAWNATRTKPTKVSTSDELPRLALAEILTNVRYRDLDEAANRGTEVHGYAQRLAHGEAVEVPEELVGHVRSYVRFLNEWRPEQAVTERVIVNRRWRYMGKFDLLAYFPRLPLALAAQVGKPDGWGLLDVKTSRSGIFSEVALQLEGYRNGETMLEGDGEVPMPAVDFVGAIWTRADGYDVITFDSGPEDFRIFLYAKQVGEWLDYKSGRGMTIKSDAHRAPKWDTDEGTPT